MKCKFKDCDKEVGIIKAGLCRGHYMQNWHGHTLKPLRNRRVLMQDDDGRVCTSCDEYKPWSEFYRHAQNSGYRSVCKGCYKKAEKEYRLGRA